MEFDVEKLKAFPFCLKEIDVNYFITWSLPISFEKSFKTLE